MGNQRHKSVQRRTSPSLKEDQLSQYAKHQHSRVQVNSKLHISPSKRLDKFLNHGLYTKLQEVQDNSYVAELNNLNQADKDFLLMYLSRLPESRFKETNLASPRTNRNMGTSMASLVLKSKAIESKLLLNVPSGNGSMSMSMKKFTMAKAHADNADSMGESSRNYQSGTLLYAAKQNSP